MKRGFLISEKTTKTETNETKTKSLQGYKHRTSSSEFRRGFLQTKAPTTSRKLASVAVSVPEKSSSASQNTTNQGFQKDFLNSTKKAGTTRTNGKSLSTDNARIVPQESKEGLSNKKAENSYLDKKNASGFKKGFLTTACKPPTSASPTLRQASQDLLALEQQPETKEWSPSLLVLTDDNNAEDENHITTNEEINRPLISILGGNDNAIRKQRPLIVSLDEDEDSSVEQVESDLSIRPSPLDAPLSRPLVLELDDTNNIQEDKADEPLFTPIQTISRVVPIVDESCSWSMTPLETRSRRSPSNCAVLNNTSTMHSTSVAETNSQDLVMVSAEGDGLIHSTDTTESPSFATVDFLGFQTRLEDVRWRLTMSKENKKDLIAREFVETLDSTQVSWTWEWIWREPMVTEARTMGMAILSMTSHISSFWPYLEPSEDKQSRVVALQAAGLLQAYLEHQPEPHNLEWWTEGLPRLVALSNTNRRTILAQKALLTGMELVGRVAEALVDDDETEENESTLKLHLWWNKGAPLLDHLIGIQSVWKREASDISERALYKEWNRGYKQCASLSQQAVDVETSIAAAWLWCRHVAGISICPKERSEEKKGDPVTDLCHVGGIRQTLCSPKCSNLTAGDIVSCLMAVLNLTKQADFDVDIFNRATCRGMLALCRGAGKKKIKSNLNPEQRQDVVEICIRLLGKSVSAQSGDLIMALLNCMWSDSDGLPLDLVPNQSRNDDHTTVPASFEMLLDALNTYNGKSEDDDGSSCSKEHDLHPTARALGALVARCIVASDSRLKLARILVAKHGMRNSTIHVFESILAEGVVSTLPDNRNGQSGGTDDTVDEKNSRKRVDRELMQYVGELIIDHISSSVYLRARIRESADALFGGYDVQWLAPKLILALANQLDGSLPTADAADYHDAIRVSLTSALERQIRHGSFDDFIHSIIHALEEVEDKQSSGDDQTKSNKNGLVGRLCHIFEGQWRQTLLQKSRWSNTDFGNLLLSIGKAMFAVPSSMTRLTLFGGVVGQNIAPETMGNMIVRDRILFAVTGIVKLCVEELDMADESEDVNVLFHRLSPLLLLRRVPAIYYNVAWKHSRAIIGKGQDLYQALASLSRRVALRLDIIDDCSRSVDRQTRVKYSTEERRLAAEIAGRCLPLGNPVDESLASHQSESCALFSRICLPAYTAALEEMSSIRNPANFVEYIRRARAALYATCHAIHGMEQQKEYFNDDVLRLTAAFAFTIVAVDADEKDDNLSNELVQLQTGCIEFFTLCIEGTLQDHVQRVETPSDSLVEILHLESILGKEENPVPPGFSTIEATRSICEVLVDIVRFGRANDPWHFDDRSVSLIQHSKVIIDDFSVPARTCLWNSFVVAAQRCQENEGKLALFAKSTVPWVIDWCISGKNTALHHPLCLAAALQVVFLLVTRTKSLNCFAEKGEDRKRYIGRTHRLALDSLKRDHHGGNAYANRSLRLAGLKLLLALVTIDQINEDETVLLNCLGPGELGETFSALHSVANIDADSEVHRLAGHILRSLKTT